MHAHHAVGAASSFSWRSPEHRGPRGRGSSSGKRFGPTTTTPDSSSADLAQPWAAGYETQPAGRRAGFIVEDTAGQAAPWGSEKTIWRGGDLEDRTRRRPLAGGAVR